MPRNKEMQETSKGITDRWKDEYVALDRSGNVPRTLRRMN